MISDWGTRLVDKEVRLRGLQCRGKGWQGQHTGRPSRVKEVVERVLEESKQKMWELAMREWDV